MSHPSAAHTTAAFDEFDPHHESHHHGHVIIRPSTLVAVLVTLMVLTGITVGAAQLEAWIAHTFEVHIPSLFNAFVAMSIAVVKAVLVFMFFMQLKYDSPLNSIVMGFCFFAVGLFLFFTLVDLGNRDAIYPYKSGEIQLGGMGINTQRTDSKGNIVGGINTQNVAIVKFAREQYLEQIKSKAATGTLVPPLGPSETPEQRYEKERAEAHAHARGGKHHAGPEVSDSNRSRPPQAKGPELYIERTPSAPDGHGH